MWSVLIFAVWHFKYFRTFPLNVKFGEQGSGCDSSFLPCGNWALCLQMSVSVKAWVFSSFPRQSPDQSLEQPVHVAATLARWHGQLPSEGEAPTERDSRPSSKLELFTVFSWIWPCTLCSCDSPASLGDPSCATPGEQRESLSVCSTDRMSQDVNTWWK